MKIYFFLLKTCKNIVKMFADRSWCFKAHVFLCFVSIMISESLYSNGMSSSKLINKDNKLILLLICQ